MLDIMFNTICYAQESLMISSIHVHTKSTQKVFFLFPHEVAEDILKMSSATLWEKEEYISFKFDRLLNVFQLHLNHVHAKNLYAHAYSAFCPWYFDYSWNYTRFYAAPISPIHYRSSFFHMSSRRHFQNVFCYFIWKKKEYLLCTFCVCMYETYQTFLSNK